MSDTKLSVINAAEVDKKGLPVTCHAIGGKSVKSSLLLAINAHHHLIDRLKKQ